MSLAVVRRRRLGSGLVKLEMTHRKAAQEEKENNVHLDPPHPSPKHAVLYQNVDHLLRFKKTFCSHTRFSFVLHRFRSGTEAEGEGDGHKLEFSFERRRAS